MALIPRQAEVDALVAILESDDHADAKSLATALLRKSLELLQDRTLYGLKVNIGGGVLSVGPWASETDAARWHKQIGGQAAVCRLEGPGRFPDVLEAKSAKCRCGHPKGTHDHPKTGGRCVAGAKKVTARGGDGCQCESYERSGT